MSRRTMLTVLVIAAVFLAGALAGAAVTRMLAPGPDPAVVHDGRARTPGRPPSAGEPGERRDPVYGLARLLDEELELTGDQRGRIEAILERRSEDAREVFQESRRRFRSHLDSTVSELEEVLSDEQAAEFQRLLEAMEERRRGDREGRR